MMTQFKTNFVAASSNPQNQSLNNSSGTYENKKMVLPGFVAGGSIGGDINTSRPSSLSATPMSGGNTTIQNRENASQRNSER